MNKKEIYFSDNAKDWDIKIIQSIFTDFKISDQSYIRKAVWQFPLEVFIQLWNEIKEVNDLLKNQIPKALEEKYSNKNINFHIKQTDLWREIIISNEKIFITEKWEPKEFKSIDELLIYLNPQEDDLKLEIKDEKICINYKWFPFCLKSELSWNDVVWFLKWWLDSYVKSWLQVWEMKKDIIKYIMTVSITLIWVIIWVIIKEPIVYIKIFLNISLVTFFLSILLSIIYWAFYINFWKNLMEKVTKESVSMFQKIHKEDSITPIMEYINNIWKYAKKVNKEKYIYWWILWSFVLWLILLILSFICK